MISPLVKIAIFTIPGTLPFTPCPRALISSNDNSSFHKIKAVPRECGQVRWPYLYGICGQLHCGVVVATAQLSQLAQIAEIYNNVFSD